MTITSDMLDIFQQPPMPHETDVGTVDPFTATELAAIGEYNDRTGGLTDCLAVDILDEYGFGGHAAQHGHAEAVSYIKTHFGWLRDWQEALDSLDAALRSCNPYDSPSNAAGRLLTHQARALLLACAKVRAAALGYLVGDAGPWPVVEHDSITTPNGYIIL